MDDLRFSMDSPATQAAEMYARSCELHSRYSLRPSTSTRLRSGELLSPPPRRIALEDISEPFPQFTAGGVKCRFPMLN